MANPALALLEFNSIAVGIFAGDAMVKRAPVERIQAGTVQPGHYLVMVVGDVASVEEAVAAGREAGQTGILDTLYLPNVHPQLVAALTGGPAHAKTPPQAVFEALGIVETHTVAAAILAADAGLKGAEVSLLQLRLADGLGGKGLALFTGLLSDVETALAIAVELANHQLLRQAIIPQLHSEMRANMERTGRFGDHFNWTPA